MPKCASEGCGLAAEGNPAHGLCILHSTDVTKDTRAFNEALALYRKSQGDDFNNIVFPGEPDFTSVHFDKNANFTMATFAGRVSFISASFAKTAHFVGATFRGGVDFTDATFKELASFRGANFSGEANFIGATFTKETFFSLATFAGGANFTGTCFAKKTDFFCTTFLGRTLFSARGDTPQVIQAKPIFSEIEVDFRNVVIQAPGAMTFVEADLKRCRFEDTDLRTVQMVGIDWPKKGRRLAVYDEKAYTSAKNMSPPWDKLERLYRGLKQTHEDARDYERAGDFHYGEKEMRRRNPRTFWGLRFFLTLYCLFSGYGERYLRPLIWAGLLFAVSTLGYLWWGLSLKEEGSRLALTSVWDWFWAAHYSFQVMTLLEPDDLVPLGYAKVVKTFQSLLGPIFFALFALALR
jgi:uncharacterized protein YjbI with pentapeptide repeats